MPTFAEYETGALSSAIYPKNQGLEYTALGLAGEAGEVAGKVSKIIRDGDKTLSAKVAILKEAGDVLWFVTALIVELGGTLEQVAVENLLKLASRKARGVIGGSGDER